MEYRKHRQSFVVEVRRPDWESPTYRDTVVARFESSGNSATGVVSTRDRSLFDSVTSFSYSESINNPAGSFSFMTTMVRDSNGKTWYERLRVRDIVLFYEQDKVVFVGILQSKQITGQMSDSSGPDQKIRFSGASVGGLLQSFKLILDLRILEGATTARSASRQLMAAIAAEFGANQRLSSIIEHVFTSYFDLMQAVGQTQTGVYAFIRDFLELSIPSGLVSRYPKALSLYQTGENDIWTILQGVINPPIQELFGRWNPDTGKYSLVVRQTPFDPRDWSQLPITRINPIMLKSYEVGNTDSQVYTVFGAFFPGSGLTRERAMVIEDFSQYTLLNTDKWAIYGYRPLFIDFKYLNRATSSDVGGLIQEYSQLLFDWYNRNDEYLAGTVTLVTDTRERQPRIGERIAFLGGQFYVEEVQKSWSYGAALTTVLTVSRGYRYSDTGDQLATIDQSEVGRDRRILS